jgi:EAL domain-containing protein (putative c-di-GMP-specific phosphodiesterase class I)
VDLNSKQLAGFEALLRWQHPTQGLISPSKFMETAENTGLLISTGQWMMFEVCKQIKTWTSSSPANGLVMISLNVSVRQWSDARFIHDLEKTLHDSGIDPSQLRLEATESTAVADPKLTATVFSNLRQLRVGVVLDDFGTGNSSLIALSRLPLAALKIDHSLVHAMQLERSATDIVELIILLAHKLKLKVIAEGIESAKQLERLRELGCDQGQGFLFSQPVEAVEAERLLRQRAAVFNSKVAGAR